MPRRMAIDSPNLATVFKKVATHSRQMATDEGKMATDSQTMKSSPIQNSPECLGSGDFYHFPSEKSSNSNTYDTEGG